MSYVVSSGDVGRTLRLVVTARNSAGSSSAASPVGSVVVAAPVKPVPTTAPSGTPSGSPTTTSSTAPAPAGLPATTITPPTGVTRGQTAVPKLSMKIRIVKVVRKGDA